MRYVDLNANMVEHKAKERDEVAEHVKAYLKKGRKIKVIPSCMKSEFNMTYKSITDAHFDEMRGLR